MNVDEPVLLVPIILDISVLICSNYSLPFGFGHSTIPGIYLKNTQRRKFMDTV